MKTGWICPRCDAANAPSVKRCSCRPLSHTSAPIKPAPIEPIVLRSSERVPTPPDPPGAPPRVQLDEKQIVEIMRAARHAARSPQRML